MASCLHAYSLMRSISVHRQSMTVQPFLLIVRCYFLNFSSAFCHYNPRKFLRLAIAASGHPVPVPPGIAPRKTNHVHRYNSLRINTYRCVCKQTALSAFRINTYAKTGGGGVVLVHYAAGEGRASRATNGNRGTASPYVAAFFVLQKKRPLKFPRTGVSLFQVSDGVAFDCELTTENFLPQLFVSATSSFTGFSFFSFFLNS